MTRIIPISQSYCDKKMYNDDEYDNHIYDSDHSTHDTRPYITLKATKLTAIDSISESSDVLPTVNGGTRSSGNEITPTKEKLRQYRLELIRKKSYSNNSPSQPNEHEHVVNSSPQKEQSNRYENDSWQQATPEKLQNNLADADRYPVNSSSKEFKDTNTSAINGRDQFSYNDQMQPLSNGQRNPNEKTYKEQQQFGQQQQSTDNLDRIDANDNANKILWASFEYRQNPSNSIYTYEPKRTQTEFVFKALFQGSDIPRPNHVYATTQPGQDLTRDNNQQISFNFIPASPTAISPSTYLVPDNLHIRNQNKYPSSTSPEYLEINPNNENREPENNHGSTHSFSNVTTPQKVNQKDSKVDGIFHSSYQSTPQQQSIPYQEPEYYQQPPPKSTQLTSRYNFGAAAPNQYADVEAECEAFGHDAPKDVRQRLNFDEQKLAAPISQFDNRGRLEFKEESNAQTMTPREFTANDTPSRSNPPIEKNTSVGQTTTVPLTNLDDNRGSFNSDAYNNQRTPPRNLFERNDALNSEYENPDESNSYTNSRYRGDADKSRNSEQINSRIEEEREDDDDDDDDEEDIPNQGVNALITKGINTEDREKRDKTIGNLVQKRVDDYNNREPSETADNLVPGSDEDDSNEVDEDSEEEEPVPKPKKQEKKKSKGFLCFPMGKKNKNKKQR